MLASGAFSDAVRIRRSVAGGRPRMDGNRWPQELARGRNEWNYAAGHIIAERCARKTVRSTNLALSRLGLSPIAVIAHKDLVCCAVYIDSMRIAQPRGRALDEA